VKITRGGSQPSAKGPADWFTGTVRIDAPFGSAKSATRTTAAAPHRNERTTWNG